MVSGLFILFDTLAELLNGALICLSSLLISLSTLILIYHLCFESLVYILPSLIGLHDLNPWVYSLERRNKSWSRYLYFLHFYSACLFKIDYIQIQRRLSVGEQKYYESNLGKEKYWPELWEKCNIVSRTYELVGSDFKAQGKNENSLCGRGATRITGVERCYLEQAENRLVK